MKHFKFLTQYYGEKNLKKFLNKLNIYKIPNPLSNACDDTYLKNKKAGIELTFSHPESIKEGKRKYPAGALVLSNIRYYGARIGKFHVYKEKLPYGIKFGQMKSDLFPILGKPEWKNPEESRLRWILNNHTLHITLNNENRVIIVSLGIPFNP